jgi:hydrogenase-4 component F
VHEAWATALPKIGFVGILIMLGTYTPDAITRLMQAVAQSIGG